MRPERFPFRRLCQYLEGQRFAMLINGHYGLFLAFMLCKLDLDEATFHVGLVDFFSLRTKGKQFIAVNVCRIEMRPTMKATD